MAAALASAAAMACAQPQAPPGGVPDRTPPRVISVSPAMYDTVADLQAPVVIRFDERLSERLQGVRSLEDAVLVSPATGRVDVERGRSQVRVSVDGGWRPGLVYRVVVLPVFSDRFQNRRIEPIELVFSTGAPIPPTALGGFAGDRLTGRPVPDARVEATRRVDSVTYVALTDTSGFFAMRHIPAGAYDVRAWLDQNRNRLADFTEPQREMQMALGFEDTVVVELPLLPRDTTAARLARAEAIDSLRVRLTFDDHFEPGPIEGRAAVYSLPDSSLVATGPLLHGARLDSLLAAERAAAEAARAAADTLVADSIRGDPAGREPLDPARTDPARMAVPPAARQQPAQRDAARPGRPLPSRELILVLPEPLVPARSYVVVVEGVTNIHGIPGGGGSARFLAPRRPDPPPAPPPDTTGAAGAGGMSERTVPAAGGGR